jgi:hypothetical protein
MTLGNMRALGAHRLIASCLNPSCRHQALIDVSKYPEETEVPSFRRLCARNVGHPNWKEQTTQSSPTGKQWR